MKSFRFLLVMAAVSQLFAQAPSFSSATNTTFEFATQAVFTVTTTGSPAPSITESGVLPAGVTFTDNGNGTGFLAGAPGQSGTFTIAFTATNGVGPGAVQNFSLIVVGGNTPPSFTSANNATFEFAEPGSFTVTTTGFPAPGLTESGGLPAGVTFTDNGNGTGTLRGTAGQSGTFTIAFTATNGVGLDAAQNFSLIVAGGNTPPSFTSANNTTFALGAPGSFIVTTTGFPAPGITESGPLPAGVTFADNGDGSGTLSGTPYALGPFSIAFTATGGVGTASQSFTLNVNVGPNLAPSITSANTKTLVVGTAGSFTVTTNGSPLPAITESGPLPAGVAFTDNGNGTATLSGTPMNGGAFSITFTANNGEGPNAVQNFTLNVDGTAITSANNATFALSTPGSFTVTTGGSPAPALTESGPLPSGVTFTDNGNGTATLSGTPAAGGVFPVAFTANSAGGLPAIQNFTLTVTQGPSFTSANNATFVQGAPGSFTVTTTGTPAPPIFEQGALPTGVTFVDNGNGAGMLSGTPGTSGVFSIGFGASNNGGKASQTFTLTVNAGGQEPAITSANNATFAAGSPGFFTVTTTGSPLPGITESGALPTGVTFVDNGNGSGTLSGTPGIGGAFPISFAAANGVSPNTVQAFVLAVSQSQNIAFTTNAPPSAAYNSNFTVAASASSGLAVVFTASGSCSNVGATYTMTGSTGTCSAIANQAGNSTFPAAPQVTQTVSATLAAQTINFFPIGTQMVGELFAVNATASSGLPVNFGGPEACGGSILGDMVTPGISGPCTIVASQPGNGLYAAATASQTFTVNGQPQTINFNPIATQTVGSPLTLAATASSGLPVTYTSSTTGICTVSAATATFLTGGTCTIVASQAGIAVMNASYAAAASVTQSFMVNGQTQTIVFSPIATQTVGAPLTLTATASSGLPVTYTSSTTGICSVTAATVTFPTGGTCTIVASQAGNSGYSAATPVSQSFTVNPAAAAQTIMFPPIPAQMVGVPFAPSATASSGLPVSFTNTNGAGNCLLSAGIVTPLTAGTCTITASQFGNASYLPANPVSQTVTVNGQAQTITFRPIAAQVVGTPLTLTATATSGLPVTFTSSTTGICAVSGTTATPVASGTCTIVASQAGSGAYASATSMTQSFTVNIAAQSITFTIGAPATAPNSSSFTVAATGGGSGNAVTFTSSGVCNNTGATFTMTNATGTCSVIANQAGNANYSAAPRVTQTVTATLAAQIITFITSAPANAEFGSVFTVAASGGASRIAVTFTSSGVCTNKGANYTMTSGTGACSVIANQAGNANYVAAPQVTQTVNATLAAQSLTFTTNAPAKAADNGSFSVAAKGGASGNAATFSSSGVCGNTGATYTMTSGTGTCSVIANQAGNANYSAAPQVAQEVNAIQVAQSITFTIIPPAKASYSSTFTVGATGGVSGNPVTFTSSGACGNTGATYTITSGTGTCSVIANQPGNANYLAAPQVMHTVNATQVAQSITFTTIPPAKASYSSTFTVAATGGASGNAVTFTSSGACTNSSATYTMTSGTGTCSVIANQAGNANYSAAPQVTHTVNAALVSQTIAFPAVPNQSGPGMVTLAATASSGLTVSYTVTSGPATVSGNILTTTGAGSVKVKASQAGSTNYSAATAVSETFTVN